MITRNVSSLAIKFITAVTLEIIRVILFSKYVSSSHNVQKVSKHTGHSPNYTGKQHGKIARAKSVYCDGLNKKNILVIV